MSGLKEKHTVEDGAFGLLHGALGVGGHKDQILDEKGEVVGEGTGATESAARERAWDDVNKKQ